MTRSRSSKRWSQEHEMDLYVRKARELGMRSRASFKLLEIDKKDKLFKPGMTVVDLGATPGGWSQVAQQRIGNKGLIFALDILPMEALAQVDFIQGDFTEQASLDKLVNKLQGQRVDVVLSDMAPNASGQRSIDQPRAIYLAELALDFTREYLQPKGCFLVKVFQGQCFNAYLKTTRQLFQQVWVRKPPASRLRSSEVYLLCKSLKDNIYDHK